MQEYEKISGRRFKINGHHYYLNAEHKTGNKYFQCKLLNSIGKKCSGSITITPNHRITKKVEHICCGIGTVDMPSEDNGLEKVQEYEKIGKRFKINGHRYYLTYKHKTGNKYFQCIYARTQKCPGSILTTPNRQIAKNVEHRCNKVCQISSQQSSKTTVKEACPTFSVAWL